MSPTILRLNGARIAIHTRDHNPAHVHVIGPGAEAKIDINTLDVIWVHGWSQKQVRHFQEFIKANQEILKGAWSESHKE